MKRFNTTGKCIPEKHYMVDISDRVEVAEKMVGEGTYFTINRGRQYGKTTLLSQLKKSLEDRYSVFSISFEGMGNEEFDSLTSFSRALFKLMSRECRYGLVEGISEKKAGFIENWANTEKSLTAPDVYDIIMEINSKNERKTVLLIDEVDQASNYEVFLQFLGILRDMYLNRDELPCFYSVILAGVYDIKNLKLKIRTENEHQYNSPWNIADSFDADMSFSSKDIESMLADYEREHNTGMDISLVSHEIDSYTSGYPFLVSRICRIIDENDNLNWDENGVGDAVKELLGEKNTLFDDIRKKLSQFPEMKKAVQSILYNGEKVPFNNYNKAFDIADMFDFIRQEDGRILIHNRIFETWMYNLFVSEEGVGSILFREGSIEKNSFIKDGHLDMKHILERFIVHYNDIYGNKDEKFHEKEGRKFFLFYLKPIINGTGNYYVEAETRDETRTDVVVDYLGEQFVVELKIWRGQSYNQRGEEQLSEYLDYFHTDKGYMLSFNFNKNKTVGVKEVNVGDKRIIEGVV